MSEEVSSVGTIGMRVAKDEGTIAMKLKVKMMEWLDVLQLDRETIRMVERIVILRISTKLINLWIRQLEMKRKEVCELAGLMGFEVLKKEVETEKSLERWTRRCSNHFTKKMKRMLYEEIDNVVWNGKERAISEWCKRNKVYDEITEAEIEEIWMKETPNGEENIRLNGKYV